MSDFTAFGSAIYSLVDAATSTPVYYALVPQGSAFPAVTVSRQDSLDDYTFTSSGVSAEYLVKAISNRTFPSEAAGIYDTLHGSINNRQLTITGFQALRFQRQSTIEYLDPDHYWHVGGVYRLDTHKG